MNDWRSMLQQQFASGIFGGNDGQGQAYVGPETQQAYAMSGLNRMQPQAPMTPGFGSGGLEGLLGLGGGGGIQAAIQAALAQQAALQQQQGQQSPLLTNPYQQPTGQPGSGGHVTLPRNPGGGLLGAYF